jgi:hypothetical protein
VVRCKICGHTLRLTEALRALFRAGGVVYPVRRVDGARSEVRIRWICARCIARAERHSASHAVDLEGDEEQRDELGN